MRIRLLAPLTLLALALSAGSASAAERYVVTVEDSVKITDVAPISKTSQIWPRAGAFVAHLSEAEARQLDRKGGVSVVKDTLVSIAGRPVGGDGKPQTATTGAPTGILRIANPASLRDGVEDNIGVGVAIADTGIAPHPDLNVVGGVDCINDGLSGDPHGHGTHVAGTVAARDNGGGGIVGVAPGTPLYAVRVLNAQGSGYISQIVCGLDWVLSQPQIKVVNMSLSAYGTDNACEVEPMHAAICRLTAAGQTVVVAAGNESRDTSQAVPGAYDEAIAVSAFTDLDGAAGSKARRGCYSDRDDSFAPFSNFGADVDIAAPGVCILSTSSWGESTTMSGTSMAAPHVAGAAALYLQDHPAATPLEVKAAIQAAADRRAPSDDPDGVWEGLLRTSTF